jgi:4-diphosphocytidyl-2-C-methyl-D-erythritol kinase
VKTTVLSPAKVNLYLKVLSRRPDGYHDLRSLVDLISLHDTIHIEDIGGDEIVVDDDRGILPRGEGNTVYRAVRMLRRPRGCARECAFSSRSGYPSAADLADRAAMPRRS